MDFYSIKTRLKEAIDEQADADMAYRFGNALMTDAEYDDLVKEISTLQEKLADINPGDELASYDPNTVGLAIPDSDERKEELPITMASMNKNKSLEESVASKDNVSSLFEGLEAAYTETRIEEEIANRLSEEDEQKLGAFSGFMESVTELTNQSNSQKAIEELFALECF